MDIPRINKPELFDKVIQQLQDALKSNVAWLDYAFGRAQRITKRIENRQYLFPACYSKNNDYVDVSPDSNLGCFSFVQMGEPQELDWIPNEYGFVESPFSLIVWFDLRKIFPNGHTERNTEAVKAEILAVLKRKVRLKEGRISFNRIWEKVENIYKEYPAIKELDAQCLMHPFGGLRFDGIIKIQESC